MVKKTTAGDCNCLRCGYYKGYCWGYAEGSHTKPVDWWCYTQMYGVKEKRSMWQPCDTDSDCYWIRTCGKCFQYKDDEVERRVVC